MQLVRAAEKSGQTPEAAIQQGLKAILCSPEFLYREEKERRAQRLRDRLAAFLFPLVVDAR